MTHTYAILEVSHEVFGEVEAKLEAANYHHAFDKDDGNPIIDMHGIALKAVAKPEPTAHTLTVQFNRFLTEDEWRQVIAHARLTPFAQGLDANAVVIELKEPPLLICIDCKNTESCAGAMARQFNHGRCVHCGGYFKVIRA